MIAVAALVPTALNSIIAPGASGIRSPSDLRGKTIGEDGSSSTDAYLTTVLRHAGLDPRRDVRRVDVGFGLVPALLTHRVDAVIGAFPNVEGVELAQRGLRPSILPVDRYGVPQYDELVVVASPSRLRSDPVYRHNVRAFLAALAEATGWARAHPAGAVRAMRGDVGHDYAGVLERGVPATLRLMHPRPGRPYGWMSRHAWKRFGRWMHRAGLLHDAPDGARLMTDAYLPR